MEGNRNVRQTYDDKLRDWLKDQVASGKTRPGRAELQNMVIAGTCRRKTVSNYTRVENIVHHTDVTRPMPHSKSCALAALPERPDLNCIQRRSVES